VQPSDDQLREAVEGGSGALGQSYLAHMDEAGFDL
jgi:hypothetical protein